MSLMLSLATVKADLAHFAFVPEEDIAVAQSERAADVSSQVE